MAAKRQKRDALDSYATKGDLQTLGSELRTEMGELRTELRTEMGELRTELRTEMGELRTEMGALRDEFRAQAVHFENVVVTHIRALGDKLDAQVERLDRERREGDDKLAQRIAALEAVVRELVLEVRQNTQSIAELRRDVNALRRDFEARPDKEQLARLEARTTALELHVFGPKGPNR
ncbi:MAG: hypothetical protein U0235_09645 [Polyangiaceae bacterium]